MKIFLDLYEEYRDELTKDGTGQVNVGAKDRLLSELFELVLKFDGDRGY